MKKELMSLVLCCFMVVGTSFVSKTFAAQTDQPAASGHASHTGHDMPKASSDGTESDTNQDTDKNVQMMQDHINKMHAQMKEIKVATEPQERQKLMEGYMTTMMDGMKMMKSMPGCKMMSEKKGMMGMMSKGENMPEGKMDDKQSMAEGKGMMAMMSGGQGMMGMDKMMKCHKMMEKKNQMMQGMMEGLIESSQMMLQMRK